MLMFPVHAHQRVSTLVELEAALRAISADVVYRGQTKHHVDTDGRISMTTSFAREGCVPPLMIKWIQYASSVIRALQGPGLPAPSEARTQAILQHYGWRSFYIDATNNSAVAAWFASHKFSSDMHAETCEDAFEAGVCLLSLRAKYSLSKEEFGHLYVISRNEVVRSGHRCDDLGEVISAEPGLRLRFLDQEACMLGPLQNALPESCIVGHIEAPVSVLAQYAKSKGLDDTNTLFPTPAEDPVLGLLLRNPWVRTSVDIGMPTFVRGLELPMYSDHYIKHLPAAVALYSQQWANAPRFARLIPELVAALFLRVPDALAYGQPTGTTSFPRLTNLLRRHKTVVIEYDGLFRYAERSDEPDYYKGIVLTLESDRVSVSALSVQHPGMRLVAAGTELGWHYSISSSGEWVRVPGNDDCPCNAPHRHEQFFCPIERIEDGLESWRWKSVGPLSMELA